MLTTRLSRLRHPRAALEHALRDNAAEILAPQSIADFEPVERAEGWVEFNFRESEDLCFSGGVIQDGDGSWGITSLGGCFPANG